jgi:hypothetical protein
MNSTNIVSNSDDWKSTKIRNIEMMFAENTKWRVTNAPPRKDLDQMARAMDQAEAKLPDRVNVRFLGMDHFPARLYGENLAITIDDVPRRHGFIRNVEAPE